MITNLSVQSVDTVIGHGPRFEVKKVLEAFETTLRGLLVEIGLMCPGIAPSWELRDQEEKPLASDDDFVGLMEFFRSKVRRHDMAEAAVHVEAQPYDICLQPFGSGQLYLEKGGDQPRTLAGESWNVLDPTPNITVMFDEVKGINAGLAEGKDLFDIIEHLEPCGGDTLPGVSRYVPPGARIEIDGWLRITFPHEAFGMGHGPLRIKLDR